jgi:hypothetical protein
VTDFTQNTGSGGQLKLSLTETSVNVGANQSTVHVVYQIFTPAGSFHNNNDIAVSLTGDVSYSANWSFNSSGGWHTIYDNSVTFTHDSNGVKSISVTASMGATGTSGVGGPASVSSGTFNLSNIVQAPTAPGTPTGTRVNDGQLNLSWTNNSSTHHEYASQDVQRSVDGGAYSTIASGLSSAATSYSDTTTSATHKYQYKIVANNAAGSATSAASTAVYMTPGTPTIGTATKQANNDVVLTWTNHAGYGSDTTYGTDIYESQNGGAFNYLASVAGGLTSWTHAAPSTAVTHAYKVLHTKGALSSALSAASNTVTLLSTANAPTGLSPSGVSQDAAGNIVLSWTHNPTDGTPQSKRHVQAKVDAGAYADLVNDSSGTSSYTVAGGTWSNGHTITWKVATAGQNGTLSADSAASSFTTSAKPTVTINTPTSTYGISTLTMTWGYFQAQSSAQASWEARLYNAGNVLLESISGTTQSSGTFATAVADGASYTVKMTVTSAAGLTSTEASQAFTVTYLLPATLTIAGAFDNTAGFTVLTVTGSAPTSGYSVLSLNGSNSNYASTPDAAALDITGDIDIRIDLELTSWTPAADTVLVAKWDNTNQRSYEVVLTTTGMIKFRLSTDGTSGTVVEAVSSVAPTPVNNRLSLRIDRNSGVVTFSTSTGADLTAATWTQLGTTQAAAGTMFASTATLKVGADGVATLAALNGKVYSVELRNSADTVVASPNFSAQAAGTTSFNGGVGLTWTLAGAAAIVTVVPATVAITSVDVQRQINGGAWVTLLTGVVLDVATYAATVQDTLPITVGTNTYRAIAYSALPSSRTSATADVVTNETTWGYLSGGDGFGTVARVRAMPSFTPSASLDKALYHFAGRQLPVQFTGEAVTSTLAVGGKLTYDSGTRADFLALGKAVGVHCWRGPDGARMFGSLSKVDAPYSRQRVGGTVAFALTELDFTEGDQ